MSHRIQIFATNDRIVSHSEMCRTLHREFIQGGLEDALKQAKGFTFATMKSVLNGKHYVRSLKGILILVGAIEKMK